MSLILALDALHITFTHLTPISSATSFSKLHSSYTWPWVNSRKHFSSLLNNLRTTSSSHPNFCLFITLYGNIFPWISLLYMKLTHYIASSYWPWLFCTSQISENQKGERENPRTTAHEISLSTLQKHLFKQFKKDILKSNLQTACLQHQKWRLTQKWNGKLWYSFLFIFKLNHKSFFVDGILFNATTNPNSKGSGDANLYGLLLKQYADRRKTNVFFQPVQAFLFQSQKLGQSWDKNQTLQKPKKKRLKTVFGD